MGVRCRWLGSWRRGKGGGGRDRSLGRLTSSDGGRRRRRAGVDKGWMFEGEHVDGERVARGKPG